MSLPDLHGWLPASVLARREGVSASTIRRRAERGLYEVTANPLGPGALYRDKGSTHIQTPVEPATGFRAVYAGLSRAMGAVRRDDALALVHLPASATGLADALGVSCRTASRMLYRLNRAGLAEPDELVRPGPRGGRPRILWRAVEP